MSELIAEIITNFTEMRQDKGAFDHLEPIPAKYGFTWVLITIFIFQMINRLVASYGPPKSVQTDVWQWRNLFVSWIHALIVGTWDLTCFYRLPEMAQDLVAHHAPLSYMMVTFSTGYFFYDFIDIVVNKRLKKMWEVCLHHLVVGGMFFYNVIYCHCIAYNCVALLAEVNTFFLHTRKLMQLCQFQFSHWLYRVNAYTNIITFMLCRFGGQVWITYGMWIWRHRVTPVFYSLLCSSMFVMLIINIVLFTRLIQNDLLRPMKGGGGAREHKLTHYNNNMQDCCHANNRTVQENGYGNSAKNGFVEHSKSE